MALPMVDYWSACSPFNPDDPSSNATQVNIDNCLKIK